MTKALEVLDAMQHFNQGFKNIRAQIEEMTDEQLIHLYEQAKEIGNVSWLIRVMVVGTAKSRAVRGDGAIASIAKEFGIGVRMAELDIAVFETFIRDNEDFEPVLPAVFYQIASALPNPEEAIELAIEQRALNPKYPAIAFKRLVEGKTTKEPASSGLFLLIPVEEGLSLNLLAHEAGLDDAGVTELYGRVKLYSIGGRNYVEITR